MKVKTLPTPLYRFFELQKSIRERMHQEQIDEANKEKEKEKAKLKKSLREKTKLKTVFSNEKSIPNTDDGKDYQLDIKLIEEFRDHCAADEVEKAVECEGRNETLIAEDMEINKMRNIENKNILSLSGDVVCSGTEETTLDKIILDDLETAAATTGPTSTMINEVVAETFERPDTATVSGKIEEDTDVPTGPKTSSPSFLSDPAYALIGRDFGVCIVHCIVFYCMCSKSCLMPCVDMSSSIFYSPETSLCFSTHLRTRIHVFIRPLI